MINVDLLQRVESNDDVPVATTSEDNEDARRIVASWNVLADADLDALERDGLLAEPRVAALVGAAKEILACTERLKPVDGWLLVGYPARDSLLYALQELEEEDADE